MVCWVCGTEQVNKWRDGVAAINSDDLKITDMRYGLTLPLYRCNKCGFVFANVRNLSNLYEELIDNEYVKSALQREKQLNRLLKQTKAFLPGKTILDVGAGNGLFVKLAKAEGYNMHGLEPSRFLAEQAQAEGLPIRNTAIPDYSLNMFDAIYMTDVIEHIAEPLPLLKQYVECLKDGGVLVIVTPNISSLTARMMGKRWWHFRIAHVGYYNKRTLEALLRQANLRLIRYLTPVWFFSAGYALERLGQYVPFLKSKKPLISLSRIFIPITFGDSILGIFQK